MAFNVMARNCDDHTKNFGFLLKLGRNWELAPQWTYQHVMSVNGKFEDITKEDLLVEADSCAVRRAKDLLADVRGLRIGRVTRMKRKLGR